jgi:hypothetical protein
MCASAGWSLLQGHRSVAAGVRWTSRIIFFSEHFEQKKNLTLTIKKKKIIYIFLIYFKYKFANGKRASFLTGTQQRL